MNGKVIAQDNGGIKNRKFRFSIQSQWKTFHSNIPLLQFTLQSINWYIESKNMIQKTYLQNRNRLIVIGNKLWLHKGERLGEGLDKLGVWD